LDQGDRLPPNGSKANKTLKQAQKKHMGNFDARFLEIYFENGVLR
jgi:hypothetical protein